MLELAAMDGIKRSSKESNVHDRERFQSRPACVPTPLERIHNFERQESQPALTQEKTTMAMITLARQSLPSGPEFLAWLTCLSDGLVLSPQT